MNYRRENTFSGSFVYIRGEDEKEHKYDVTGMISLAKAYEERDLSYKLVHCLVSEIIAEGKRLENEGKNLDGWILNPNYVFFSSEKDSLRISEEYPCESKKKSQAILECTGYKIKYLYYPENTNLSFESEIINLAEFVIDHVDYKDKKAVVLAYDFYKSVYQKNYVLESILI